MKDPVIEPPVVDPDVVNRTLHTPLSSCPVRCQDRKGNPAVNDMCQEIASQLHRPFRGTQRFALTLEVLARLSHDRVEDENDGNRSSSWMTGLPLEEVARRKVHAVEKRTLAMTAQAAGPSGQSKWA